MLLPVARMTNAARCPAFQVHPFIAAYIRQGWFFRSLYWQWRRRYGMAWRLITDQSMELLQYKVLDADRNEIDLKQPIDAHV